MLPVGLCDGKITNVHSILTSMFKNILRRFEAEIFKMFKEASASPKTCILENVKIRKRQKLVLIQTA